jgi:hypothetical protein
MGLTIHYSLTTDLTKPRDIRELLAAVRRFALDLPFESVGEIIEFSGDEPNAENESARWLRIQAEGCIEIKGGHYRVPPKHCIAFSTWPGQGCEAANIGFCSYPAYIQVEGKRIATKLKGWSWSSFCKTQYASNPKCGGVQNFIRCHLCVVKVLSFIQATTLARVDVDDEGGYWQQRDIEALVKEVGSWNEFLAGFTSQLRDLHGKALESAITQFPDYEHLEAKGLEQLAKLKGKTTS